MLKPILLKPEKVNSFIKDILDELIRMGLIHAEDKTKPLIIDAVSSVLKQTLGGGGGIPINDLSKLNMKEFVLAFKFTQAMKQLHPEADAEKLAELTEPGLSKLFNDPAFPLPELLKELTKTPRPKPGVKIIEEEEEEKSTLLLSIKNCKNKVGAYSMLFNMLPEADRSILPWDPKTEPEKYGEAMGQLAENGLLTIYERKLASSGTLEFALSLEADFENKDIDSLLGNDKLRERCYESPTLRPGE